MATSQSKTNRPDDKLQIARAIAFLLTVVTLGYMACIVAVPIPKERRLDVAELGILVLVTVIVSMLCVPSFLSRIKTLKFPGGELELLEKLQVDAEKNQRELDDIRFVLTLLLAPSELQHLKNLKSGQTKEYVGGSTVRAELRKLRTLGLIETLPDRRIAELDDRKSLNLAQLAFLTDRGKRYLERLESDN